MAFWSRSAGIVDWVWLTGIVLPALSAGPGAARVAVDEVLADQRLRPRLAGGVLVELAEARAVTWMVTTALRDFWSRLIALIVPAGTPATLKSAPVTRPKAFWNSIL